jgi:hypothetical protein
MKAKMKSKYVLNDSNGISLIYKELNWNHIFTDSNQF